MLCVKRLFCYEESIVFRHGWINLNMKRVTTEAPKNRSNTQKWPRQWKYQLERNRCGSNLNVQHLELCFKHRFLVVSVSQPKPAPRFCTTLRLHLTSNAVDIANTPAKHVRYVLGQTNVGKFNQRCAFLFKLEDAPMSHCKKDNNDRHQQVSPCHLALVGVKRS